MGSGGLMQLVAYGAQDIYLTGNPQITFFKVVYRRHTNFAMESIEQTFNGAANFGKKVQCTISRNGDLIHRMYLQATLPAVDVSGLTGGDASKEFRWLDYVGEALINNVYIEIGGQQIDKHYGDWLHIWNELTQEPGKQAGYDEMIGHVDALKAIKSPDAGNAACAGACATAVAEPRPAAPANENCTPEYTLYVPLQFWFCRNPGLALPLIALQYHEVKVWMEFNELRNLMWTNSAAVSSAVAAAGLVSASLYVDYIYLDTDERRRFAQVSHEYLIEQLQFTGGESVTSSASRIKLNFNHPVKELVWVVQRDSFVACDTTVDAYKGQQAFNYSDLFDQTLGPALAPAGKNPVVSAKIQLNGHDRFSERDGKYFNLVQPYQHHTNCPQVGINVYSFALHPEQHQPSGTCNFSRIDNATLSLTLCNNAVNATRSAQVRVYATNYNVLRIMSGMGGLAYSN